MAARVDSQRSRRLERAGQLQRPLDHARGRVRALDRPRARLRLAAAIALAPSLALVRDRTLAPPHRAPMNTPTMHRMGHRPPRRAGTRWPRRVEGANRRERERRASITTTTATAAAAVEASREKRRTNDDGRHRVNGIEDHPPAKRASSDRQLPKPQALQTHALKQRQKQPHVQRVYRRKPTWLQQHNGRCEAAATRSLEARLRLLLLLLLLPRSPRLLPLSNCRPRCVLTPLIRTHPPTQLSLRSQ